MLEAIGDYISRDIEETNSARVGLQFGLAEPLP
jgi:hypothetical protein